MSLRFQLDHFAEWIFWTAKAEQQESAATTKSRKVRVSLLAMFLFSNVILFVFFVFAFVIFSDHRTDISTAS